MTLLHGVYEVTTSILTGPNPTFGKKQFQLSHPLDTAHLCLLYDGSTTALPLAPLIHVTAGTHDRPGRVLLLQPAMRRAGPVDLLPLPRRARDPPARADVTALVMTLPRRSEPTNVSAR